MANPQIQLDELMKAVINENASDLHLSSGKVPFLRVNSELIPLANRAPLSFDETREILRLMVQSEKKIEQLLARHEIDFAYEYQGKLRLRGNASIHSGQIGIALRSIGQVKGLDELMLPPVLETFTHRKQGFFIIVGPVGQGKSTTMAALIDLINTNRREHIVTIEYPIEYLFEDKNSVIDQREVGVDSHSFESALKSVFRQDVNVIMVGEMRSTETIATAVTAAETGHLVFSTLHTNNASQTVDRIIDSFPANQQSQIRAQLASSLVGVFSQRLIPSLRGGLVPAYELMINNNAIANLIREARTHEIPSVIETGFESGMIDMNRSLMDLVRRGDITIDTARSYSLNPQALDRMMS